MAVEVKTGKTARAADDPTWVPNATYPKRPIELAKPSLFETWMQYGIDTRTTVHFMGDHGTGKTSKIFELAQKLGLQMVYINLANITPDDKLAVAPKRREDGELVLQQMITEDLDLDCPYMIYLDDARQAQQKVQNQFMQLTCEWQLGLHKLPNLKLVVMSDNEGAQEGIQTSEDPAVADRKVTVRISANDTGWRYALAAKYAQHDLSAVFRVWDSLDSDLRHVLSPRCLDHVIYAGLNGFPLIYGLPMMAGKRVQLVSEKVESGGGKRVLDRTEEILDKIAAGLGVPNRESIPDMANKVIDAALRDNLTVLMQGPPGCGKTKLARAKVAAAGLREVYYSMPFTDPEALVVPMPTKDGKLKMLLAEELSDPSPYGIIWDEYNRPSSKAAFAKLMEATQQKMIAGIPLTGCRAQIALCNPPEWMGRKMSVTRNNIAQADRFVLSVEVTPEDIPANEWLLATYGDTAATVLEWYKNDIPDEARQWITKRTIERFITLHKAGMPLENGKIYLGEGSYAPVSLVDLEARLAERPMARLKEIAENVDEWERKLRLSSETSEEGTNDMDAVHQAFSLAELSQLQENIDTVVRLVKYFPPKLKGTFFIGTSTEVLHFWIEALRRMANEAA